MNIIKTYGVITNYENTDDDDFIETRSYAQACQLMSSMIKAGDITDGCVVVRYSLDESEWLQ